MLPDQFTDRFQDRDGPDFTDSVCWHLLLGGRPAVETAVRQVQGRLARFTGLHMTPIRWLHITVLLAGSAAELTQADMDEMLTRARGRLGGLPPVPVTLGRVLYHPQGIALAVSPRGALDPVFEAAQEVTREVTGRSGASSIPGRSWVPHLTLCYSTGLQAAAPVIAELGQAVPACEVMIDEISLVIQHGSELDWNWRPIGTARLGGGTDA